MAPLDAREAAPRCRWQRCRSQGGPQGPDPTAGRRCGPRPRRGCGLVPRERGPALVCRRRRGRGATLKARGRGSYDDRARAPDPAVLGPPATTRDPTHPSPEELHGNVRMGCAFGGECPALGREACIGERAAGCAWGVRSRHNARCTTPDSPADRPAVRWPRAAGAHGACGRARTPGAGGSAYEVVHEGLPGAHGACAQAERPLHGNGFPNRPTADASDGARQGADEGVRFRGVRPLRGGCPGPRPKRRVPVAERAGDHGACAQAGYPLRGNGSPNPPRAVRPAKSGQVIMGRAVGSGRPVRSGSTRAFQDRAG